MDRSAEEQREREKERVEDEKSHVWFWVLLKNCEYQEIISVKI